MHATSGGARGSLRYARPSVCRSAAAAAEAPVGVWQGRKLVMSTRELGEGVTGAQGLVPGERTVPAVPTAKAAGGKAGGRRARVSEDAAVGCASRVGTAKLHSRAWRAEQAVDRGGAATADGRARQSQPSGERAERRVKGDARTQGQHSRHGKDKRSKALRTAWAVCEGAPRCISSDAGGDAGRDQFWRCPSLALLFHLRALPLPHAGSHAIRWSATK